MTDARHRHQPELQSIRGLAALAVVIYHCLSFYNVSPTLSRWSELLLNAHAQVVLFFVLSGLVLSGSLMRKQVSLRNYLVFGIGRAARIYPALWVAVGLACLYIPLREYLPAAQNRSALGLDVDLHRITRGDVIGSLLGARAYPLPQLWSIKCELIAGLAMPALAWMVAAARTWFYPVLVTVLLGIVSMKAGLDGQYLVDFALGAMAMRLILTLRAGDVQRGSLPIALTLLVIMILFRQASRNWAFDVDYHAPVPALIEGIAAALLLVVLECSDMNRSVLLAPTLVWLGDISYGVYLLHFPVLQFGSRLLPLLLGHVYARDPNSSALILTVATVAVVLPLSHFCYRLVELPGIRVGAWIIRHQGRFTWRTDVTARLRARQSVVASAEPD